jgi:kynureninase
MRYFFRGVFYCPGSILDNAFTGESHETGVEEALEVHDYTHTLGMLAVELDRNTNDKYQGRQHY